ncbi:MAG: class I SAM-dependent methyltransferase [Actinomycetota bacterium]|nr:class I SAM-dependent methyltransferase [Actinomycetota bacterium]
MDVATAYDGLAHRWDIGAGHVYRPLARALVAASPIPIDGRLVLDAGSGTGAIAEAAAGRGARIVAADRAASMVAYQGTQRWPGIAADVLALPFRGGAFDVAFAGFLLNHLAPDRSLAELARVVRPGGAVLASTWAVGEPDPVKASIDAVITSSGWIPPAWYRALKTEVDPVAGDPEALAAAAEHASLTEVRATICREDLKVRDPGLAVAYRLSMPHIAPWLSSLQESAAAQVTGEAMAAVTPHLRCWRPAVIVLVGRVVAHPNLRAADRSKAAR